MLPVNDPRSPPNPTGVVIELSSEEEESDEEEGAKEEKGEIMAQEEQIDTIMEEEEGAAVREGSGDTGMTPMLGSMEVEDAAPVEDDDDEEEGNPALEGLKQEGLDFKAEEFSRKGAVTAAVVLELKGMPSAEACFDTLFEMFPPSQKNVLTWEKRTKGVDAAAKAAIGKIEQLGIGYFFR